MKYYKLQPEVPGELLMETSLDTSTHPPKVLILNVIFEAWTGDDLLDIFPCFFVTDRLKVLIEAKKLTGCSFEDFGLVIGEYAPPEASITKFWRMVPAACERSADFSTNLKGYLIVSEAALNLLKSLNVRACDVSLIEE